MGLHQWLGIAVGLLAAYHLLTHWTWVKSVSQRLARTSGQAQAYYLVDASLLLGFTGTLVSGLIISTWLDLPLGNFSVWRALHVAVSVVTLGLVCLKIALHWRWITSIARRYVFQPALGDVSHEISGGTARGARPGDEQRAQQRLASRAFTERRDFLKLAGVIGAAAFISLASALDLDESQAASSSSQAADAAAEAAVEADSDPAEFGQSSPANSVTSGGVYGEASGGVYGGVSGGVSGGCSQLCPRGCTYPGHCRRYTDANGNNRCDLGECL